MKQLTRNEIIEDKLKIANDIVTQYIKDNYDKSDWRYQDFVNENRFFNEAKDDKELNLDILEPEKIAEYALDKICKVGVLELTQYLSIGRL